MMNQIVIIIMGGDDWPLLVFYTYSNCKSVIISLTQTVNCENK